MRRTASEVLRSLQMRVARLERHAGLLPVSSEMNFRSADEVESEAIDYLREHNPGVEWDVSSVKFKREDGDSGYVTIEGRFKTKNFVMVNYQGGEVLATMNREQPIKGCRVKNESYDWGYIAGDDVDLYYNIQYDHLNGTWVLENRDDKFEVESTFRTEEDIKLIVEAVKRKLR